MRPVFVWLHRYVGLAVAAFLLIEGLTGALLAFNADLSRALDPRTPSHAATRRPETEQSPGRRSAVLKRLVKGP